MVQGTEPLRAGEPRALLTDGVPVCAEVNGVRYPFRWDFRCGLLLTELFADERWERDGAGRMRLAVKLFSPPLWAAVERGEVTAAVAFEAVAWFYACGRAAEGERGGERPHSVLDFSADDERIYAAFRQVYGIDLCETPLHWWKFTAMLRCLPEDCALMGVIRLRSMDTSLIADEELRRSVRRARAAVRIRKNRKEEMTE